MNHIWKSSLPPDFKVKIFRSTIEPILLYSAETWTFTESLVKTLDGYYTRLLRYAQNISWQSKTTNIALYRDLELISIVLKRRRIKFVGHCFRSQNSAPQPISDILFFDLPQFKSSKRGAKPNNYQKQLLNDCDRDLSEITQLKKDMLDRDIWKSFVKN
jgi:hypothetical protein